MQKGGGKEELYRGRGCHCSGMWGVQGGGAWGWLGSVPTLLETDACARSLALVSDDCSPSLCAPRPQVSTVSPVALRSPLLA